MTVKYVVRLVGKRKYKILRQISNVLRSTTCPFLYTGKVTLSPTDLCWSRYEAKHLDQVREQTKILRIYFHNHHGGKAAVNAMQFKQMNGISLLCNRKE
jgi:uncharacterized protein YecE (DUF72 family)